MLTQEGCRARQQRLRARLDAAGVGGVLISAPRDIYYLTGLLPENGIYPFPSVLYLGTRGASWLATWMEEGDEGAARGSLMMKVRGFAFSRMRMRE